MDFVMQVRIVIVGALIKRDKPRTQPIAVDDRSYKEPGGG